MTISNSNGVSGTVNGKDAIPGTH